MRDSGGAPPPRSSRRRAYYTGTAVLYALWYQLTQDVPSRTRSWGPRWLARLLSRALTEGLNYVGSPIRSIELPAEPFDPTRQHMVVWHPHGAYTCMALLHCAHQAVTKRPLGWYAAVAPVLFKLPGLRELLLLFDARSVGSKSVNGLVAAGATVGIQPGGVPEQLQTNSRREVAVFPPRLGFIRLAMRYGVPLLPAYIMVQRVGCFQYITHFRNCNDRRCHSS